MRLILLAAFALSVTAQTHFEVDATWPKPLPEGWITGQLGGVCADSHDHIAVVDRRDITEEEKETTKPAPPILMFELNHNPSAIPESVSLDEFAQGATNFSDFTSGKML